MALKIAKTIWVGHGKRFGPGDEKELFKEFKTKKDRQPLVDRGLLVEEADPAQPDPEPEEEEEEGNAPWKGDK